MPPHMARSGSFIEEDLDGHSGESKLGRLTKQATIALGRKVRTPTPDIATLTESLATGVEEQHIPWYIIDPTGHAIRQQRLGLWAKLHIPPEVQRTAVLLGQPEARGKSSESFARSLTRDSGVAMSKPFPWWSHLTLFPTWDAVTTVVLLFTVVVTPFEVGFLPPPSDASEPLFIINRFIDLVFVLDLVFQFLIMVPASDASAADGAEWKTWSTALVSDDVHRWEMRLDKIAIRYLFGWFLIDFLSIASMTFDILPLFNSNSESTRAATVIRVVRALRLIKLLRLLRTSRIAKRVKEHLSLTSTTLTLLILLFQVLIIVHSLACLFAIITTFAESPLKSWLGTFGFCRTPLTLSNVSGTDTDVECVDPAFLYLQTLLWAVGMLIKGDMAPNYGPYEPVRYGFDTEFTTGEYVSLLILRLFSTFVWAVLFGRLLRAITHSDPTKALYNDRLDNINRFAETCGLDGDMKRQLRRYFYHTMDIYEHQRRLSTFATLSPALVQKVTWRLNKLWLNEIAWCQMVALNGKQIVPEHDRIRFLVDMVLCMEPIVFAPKESPRGGRFYLMTAGEMLYRTGGNKVTLTRGDYWGEDEVLALSVSSNVRASILSLTYVHAQWIGSKQMLSLRQDHPKAFLSVKAFLAFRSVLRFVVELVRTGPKAALTEADVGKQIVIKDGALSIDGRQRHVNWLTTNSGQHPNDLSGTITKLVQCNQGTVFVDHKRAFENPTRPKRLFSEVSVNKRVVFDGDDDVNLSASFLGEQEQAVPPSVVVPAPWGSSRPPSPPSEKHHPPEKIRAKSRVKIFKGDGGKVSSYQVYWPNGGPKAATTGIITAVVDDGIDSTIKVLIDGLKEEITLDNPFRIESNEVGSLSRRMSVYSTSASATRRNGGATFVALNTIDAIATATSAVNDMPLNDLIAVDDAVRTLKEAIDKETRARALMAEDEQQPAGVANFLAA